MILTRPDASAPTNTLVHSMCTSLSALYSARSPVDQYAARSAHEEKTYMRIEIPSLLVCTGSPMPLSGFMANASRPRA